MSVCSVVRWTGLGLSAARVLCSWESVCMRVCECMSVCVYESE